MPGITVPRNFAAGEVIFIEKPFIEVFSREFKDVACGYCFKRVPNLKSCKACLNVKYCEKSCQKKDWKNHKLECQHLKNLPSDDTEAEDLTRLLGNTILKIKDKDWKTIKSNILGIEFSFDDIETSIENISETYRHIYYSSMKEYTRKYIGDENMPNEDEFRQIFGKVTNSKCVAIQAAFRTYTVGIIGLPLIENRCIPNCCLIPRDDVFVMKAIKNIKKSEKNLLTGRPLMAVEYGKKMKLSYTTNDLNSPVTHLFMAPCRCTDCRLPYGESALSKIIDEQKALRVIIETQQFIDMWHSSTYIRSRPEMKFIVDDLLEKHKGVLGNTNILHLKLLFIKCFKILLIPSLERKRNLLELEKNIVATFGEYYPELALVYQVLSDIFFSMGNISEGTRYLEKVNLFL